MILIVDINIIVYKKIQNQSSTTKPAVHIKKLKRETANSSYLSRGHVLQQIINEFCVYLLQISNLRVSGPNGTETSDPSKICSQF